MTEQKRFLLQYTNGDVNAMTKLIEEYKDDLYNLCFRLCFTEPNPGANTYPDTKSNAGTNAHTHTQSGANLI